MQETYYCTRALEFLKKRDPTRPFFMCLSFEGPHPPWCPPQVYYDQFINRDMPEPFVGDWSKRHATEGGYPMDVNTWRGVIPKIQMQRARAAYFAYLAYLDGQIGRVVNRVMRWPTDTFFVMTSDHGEMLGDHNLWRKSYAYESSARVPFVTSWSNTNWTVRNQDKMQRPRMPWERNREISSVVGWEDLMPTFLELAGAPIPDAVEGRSIVPLLCGSSEGWREYYHGEHAPAYEAQNANQFLTDGIWKYIWNPSTGEEQLFHLAKDPNECHELAKLPAHADTLTLWRKRLIAKLADWPDGLSDGKQLISKIVPPWRGPHQRQAPALAQAQGR